MGFFKNRVTVALIGVMFFGGVGALIAALPVLPHAVNTSLTSPAAVATDAPTTTVSSTEVPTATAGTVAPTATQALPTPTARATATSTATPTATQATDLHGTISNIQSDDRQSFTLTLDAGGSVTVIVGGSTQYQGVSGFSALRSGMVAKVSGTYGSSTRFNATLVHVGG